MPWEYPHDKTDMVCALLYDRGWNERELAGTRWFALSVVANVRILSNWNGKRRVLGSVTLSSLCLKGLLWLLCENGLEVGMGDGEWRLGDQLEATQVTQER